MFDLPTWYWFVAIAFTALYSGLFFGANPDQTISNLIAGILRGVFWPVSIALEVLTFFFWMVGVAVGRAGKK